VFVKRRRAKSKNTILKNLKNLDCLKSDIAEMRKVLTAQLKALDEMEAAVHCSRDAVLTRYPHLKTVHDSLVN
jgi:hypothetical protein